MEGHIFISYSRADAAGVKKLYDDLIHQGLNCWLDVEAIPSGADWDKELQKAIETCAHFVVICSPNSMASRNVQAEWQYAFDLKKPLYPFVLEPCEVPFRLRIYQHIDVFKLGYEQAVQELVRVLPAASVKEVLPKTSTEVIPKKVEALIKRAVENWRSFGLLLDAEAFAHIDSDRNSLEALDASALALIYLSARRNHRSQDYWVSQLRQNSSALDMVEDVLIDQLDEKFSYQRPIEFETIASNRLLSKFAHLINLIDDEAKIDVLLDVLERVLLNHQQIQVDVTEIEAVLMERFMRSPSKLFARALGWMNSTSFLQHAFEKLKDKPLTAVHDDPYFYGLAYMTDVEATNYLQSLSPDAYGFIPAGWFTMGDLSPDKQLDYPLHEVFAPSFWLAKSPVTIADFRQFRSGLGSSVGRMGEDCPMYNIHWRDAKQYAAWMMKQSGLPMDLPTEAMWEKAASWNPQENRKLKFPWGDTPDKTRCNTIESGINHITPVNQFSPQGDSPYGIQDMIGNVWEWTSSKSYPYPYCSRDGREDSSSYNVRILRGSSYFAKRGFEHGATTRIAFEEDYAFQDAGFRLAILIAR